MYLTDKIKHLLLRNSLAKESQILFGSLGRRTYFKKVPGNMTRIAVMPIYGKNLLKYPKSYDLETLHAACETQVVNTFCK